MWPLKQATLFPRFKSHIQAILRLDQVGTEKRYALRLLVLLSSGLISRFWIQFRCLSLVGFFLEKRLHDVLLKAQELLHSL